MINTCNFTELPLCNVDGMDLTQEIQEAEESVVAWIEMVYHWVY
jgi:hypothetical protein